jgi:hypothetical protein
MMKHLKWFATKHGIVVDLFILSAIFATVQYYTYDTVSFVFQILALVAISPVALFIVLSLLIGIPVNMIRGTNKGRENWPVIKQWTKIQMWFNKPWTPYK